jgi:hypothetical protein
VTKVPLLFEVQFVITTDDARLLRKLLDLGLTVYLATAKDSRPALQLVVTFGEQARPCIL